MGYDREPYYPCGVCGQPACATINGVDVCSQECEHTVLRRAPSDPGNSAPLTVAALLLVPGDGDPFRLLAAGPCGESPPRVVRQPVSRTTRRDPSAPLGFYVDDSEETRWVEEQGTAWEDCHPRALALAWRGVPLAAGLDRASRLASLEAEGEAGEHAWGRNAAQVRWDGGLAGLVPYARLLGQRLGCEVVVVLDTPGGAR